LDSESDHRRAGAGQLQGMLAERLAAGAGSRGLRAGDWLFRQGQQADNAFIVQSGRLEVVVEGMAIRTVKRGGVIGELALLTGEPRSASVRAVRDCELLEISREALEQAMSDDRRFALSLCRALAAQLAASTAPPRDPDPIRTVAIVALDGGIAADDVAERLAQELEPAGHATVLRRDSEGKPASDAGRLDRAAAGNRWVILAASAGPADPWTRTCLAEADRVIALSQGRPSQAWLDSVPALRDCELWIVGASVAPSLLDVVQPRTTQVLVDEHALRRCVAVGARRLRGRAVGIVLSGGGARAFAHLGVVEELRAAGAQIDRVAGASMGALIAGAVAQDLDDAAIYEAVHRNFVERNPSGDYTLPLYSLVRGGRTRRLLVEGFGTARIEQLPRRFFCVSTDLNTRSLVVHRTGPLHQAVFASLAIPGVFPPIPTSDGRLLVDGGVLDNLPVETMALEAEGPVIAVDVTHGGPWQPGPRRPGISWRTRTSAMLSGQEHELPRLAETMLRTLAVGSRDTAQSASRHADLVITPQVQGAGMLDWRALPRMREAGRAAVRRLLVREPDALRRYL
jgi:predicted acylesterase/phospholipase RssA/CRP-like cAMP-binding protein